MGFLEVGVPIAWADLSADVKETVRADGLKQLVHIWNVNAGRQDTQLFWGDEQEFTMVHLDHRRKEARLVLEAPRVLGLLKEKEESKSWDDRLRCCKQLFLNKSKRTFLRGAEWHPEFGNHMVEATPSPPYSLSVEGLLDIEESMTSRRLKLQEVLTSEFDDVYACSVTTLPNFGALTANGEAVDYVYNCTPEETTSFFAGSTSIINKLPNPHPRFPTLVQNVNARRGTKISCLMPVDDELENITRLEYWEESLDEIPEDRSAIAARDSELHAKGLGGHPPVKGYSYADNFGHGMSMCCLQVTFGAPQLRDSLYLYDQMVVLAPLFLALSAATPALFGHISGLDTRWKVLEQTCDCRTEEELKRIPQSRYGVAPMFISDDSYLDEHEKELNDVLLPYDEPSYAYLKSTNSMSDRCARHFATLWLRDPLVVFSDKIEMDYKTHSDHFENIQSTNWNTVRFKPPPPSADGVTPHNIGWRVELRTPDLQLSDFQNAALSGIASLLALAILREHWNFYIPISKVRENMERAHQKDSCISQRFWSHEEGLRSLSHIFLNKDTGIIPRLDAFVSEEWRSQRCSSEAVEQYRLYAAFIRNRVLGRNPTNARELRDLIHRQQMMNNSADQDISTPPFKRRDMTPQTRPSTPEASCIARQPSTLIDHNLNYEMVKYSVLAGYDHDVQLAHQDVHSKMRSAPHCLHICQRSPVLQSLSKLVSEDLPHNLPNQLQVKAIPQSPTPTVGEQITPPQLGCYGCSL